MISLFQGVLKIFSIQFAKSEYSSLPGRLCMGVIKAIIVRAPFINPELPIPATALPIINMFEDFAMPHNNDPSSNRARKERNVY
jgi:hypothetical protein